MSGERWFDVRFTEVGEARDRSDWYRECWATLADGTSMPVTRNIKEINLNRFIWRLIDERGVTHEEARELTNLVNAVASWKEFEGGIE